MKIYNLEGTPRETVGKKASKELRKSGLIPAVLYGSQPIDLPYGEALKPGEKIVETGNNKGVIVTDLTVTFDGVRKLIFTPDIYLVEIAIKGGRTVKAILKEAQYHPVTDDILHLDFLEVFDNKPVQMEVPVVLEGHAVGVRAGGKLNQSLRKIKVQALAVNIPERLIVNIDHLELGKVIKVGELKYDNIDLISPKNSVVCMVKMTRAAQSAATAAAK
ncbi:MAG: 50S ribosomal protein L25 [Tannerella sp.]|jgi:large subunit ribosomal protein L25|nr:50S ribosomal protein L25 [Tannerella sp.]